VSTRRIVVVGAGVAGLAAAHALVRDAPDADVSVLEAGARAGGLVETERTADGFLVDHGADCLLTTKPWGIDAVRALGIEDQVVTGPEPRRSFLATGERLEVVPGIFAGPTPAAVLSLLRTPLLSIGGKMRVALEPFVPRRRERGDESVASFLDRRFGRELRAKVLTPLMGGIYGGRPETLSAEVCIPRLCDFERDRGSVTRGMYHALRARRRLASETRHPVMVSLRNGMASLPDAFARELGARLRLGVAVERVDRTGTEGFRLTTSAGSLDATAVIIAVPAWQAPRLVEGLDAELASMLASVRHQPVDCVTMAWDGHDVPHELDGTGFVTAADDPRPTRACTWASRKWPGRAPAGRVLLRCVLHEPDAPDEEVVAAARRDLRELMGITAAPALLRVWRRRQATPIYEVGAPERMAALRARARASGALAFAGNAHGGIGIPDCIRSGEEAAGLVRRAFAGR